MSKKISMTIAILLGLYALVFSQNNYGFKVIGRVLPGEANVVTSSGNTCYVGAGNTLQIIDVSNPAQPAPLGFIDLPDVIEDIVVVNNLAYVADNDAGGLIILDVSNPAEIEQKGSLSFSNGAFGICIRGDFAYIAGLEGGFIIVNIANPQSPYQVGSFPVDWAALNVDVQDNIACVASGYGGLYFLDISNPSSPTQLGLIDYQGTWAYDVKISGSYAYMGYSLEEGGGGLYVIDIANPNNPQIAGTRSFSNSARRLDYDNDHVFVALEESGMLIVNVATPNNPQVIGGWSNGQGNNICFDSDLVFLTGVDEGLRVFQASDLYHPQLSCEFPTYSKGQDVVIAGNYAYIAEQPSGYVVIDITDPQAATSIYSKKFFYDSSNQTYGGISPNIDADDDYLYITNRVDFTGGHHEFRVYDLTDPEQPDLLDTYSLTTSVRGFYVTNELAYLGCGGSLKILDLIYPDEIELANEFEGDWDEARGMDVDGDMLYLATTETGLRILDISSEIYPDIIGNLDTGGDARIARFFHNHVYIPDWDNGLRIIDVDDPTAPYEVANYGSGEYESCLDVAFIDGTENDYAIVCYDDEVIALNITDPAAPWLKAIFKTGDPYGVYTRNDTIYIADRDHGLFIMTIDNQVDIPDDNEPSLPANYFAAQNFPNPFNSSTTIEFTIQQKNRITVNIYDILGQHVATLYDGETQPGTNRVIWNGLNSEGRSVSSGLYFYKIADEFMSTVKGMIYIK